MTFFTRFSSITALTLALALFSACQIVSSAYETYQGNKAEADGRLDVAIKHYTAAIGHAPEVAESYITRGGAYSLKGDFKSALDDFSRAIELAPANPVYHFNRGNAHLGLGMESAAIEDFSRAIEFNPNGAGAIRRRGLVYFQTARFAEAKADFERLITLSPDDPFAPVWLYLVEARGGHPDRSHLIGPLEKGIVGDWVEQIYGLFLEKVSPAEMVEYVQTNENLESFDPDERLAEANFYIGQYHLIRGNKQKARRAFLKATDTGPLGIYEFLAAKSELAALEAPATP